MSQPEWPALESDHPLMKFIEVLPAILDQAEYDEVYGIDLKNSTPFHVKLILQKFLRANANDLEKAKEQLLSTLKWRKSFQPLKAKDEVFDEKRFGGLGYILTLENVPDSTNAQDVAAFNIYGSVKDFKETFEDIEGFMRWRVALMELTLEQLKLGEVTKPIPDYGKGVDPYQAFQIHDYLQVSFLRQNPYTKAATKVAIDTFKNFYPETLSRKFFVNVPIVMGWMFTALSVFLSKETVQKFTILSYGEYLAGYIGQSVPVEYGGKGEKLSTISSIKTKFNESDHNDEVSVD
ncbi:phosphatidylinositol transfer protein [Acrasis kona]|uniref:Phosphatidylinositol transfer protein n=1 Tax=Acrasis kona TaxID=1008807 RepID=A0AAW2YMI7_9EUKA